MPESYENATEGEAAKDDFDPGPEQEYDPSVETKTVDEVTDEVKTEVTAVPDYLLPDSDQSSGDTPDFGGRRGQDQIVIDPDDLAGMNQEALLKVIARVSIAQIAALFDIADAVEPFSTITVSGTNATSDAGNPEVVVPQSKNQNVPTRTIMIRADRNNNHPIYIGDDKVQPYSGFVLEAGEFIVIETDLRGEELYMSSDPAGQQVNLLGMV